MMDAAEKRKANKNTICNYTKCLLVKKIGIFL